MSRKRAIRWLYARHRSEWDFGWHDPNPVTRANCREHFTVAYVARLLSRNYEDGFK